MHESGFFLTFSLSFFLFSWVISNPRGAAHPIHRCSRVVLCDPPSVCLFVCVFICPSHSHSHSQPSIHVFMVSSSHLDVLIFTKKKNKKNRRRSTSSNGEFMQSVKCTDTHEEIN